MPEGFTVWFSGKPLSGKTTAVNAAAREIENRGFKVEIIDEDDLYQRIWGTPAVSVENRAAAETLIGFFCRRLNNLGVVCLVAAVSAAAETREKVRETVEYLVEIQCEAPGKTLMTRLKDSCLDEAHFRKISESYEAPENPALILKTDVTDPDLCAAAVMVKLQEMGYIETDEEEYTDEERKAIDERLKSLGYM